MFAGRTERIINLIYVFFERQERVYLERFVATVVPFAFKFGYTSQVKVVQIPHGQLELHVSVLRYAEQEVLVSVR